MLQEWMKIYPKNTFELRFARVMESGKTNRKNE